MPTLASLVTRHIATSELALAWLERQSGVDGGRLVDYAAGHGFPFLPSTSPESPWRGGPGPADRRPPRPFGVSPCEFSERFVTDVAVQ